MIGIIHEEGDGKIDWVAKQAPLMLERMKAIQVERGESEKEL
jgi:hypothetical protein